MEKKRKRIYFGFGTMLPVYLAVLCMALVLGICEVVNRNEYTFELTLEGQREITLEYGSDFSDPGASAVYWETLLEQEIVDVPVTVEGTVDTATVGTYELRYVARHGKYTLTDTRQVHVVDTRAPAITLIYVPGSYTLPGEAYQEEGFRARDGYDGDITDKVVRTEKDGRVTYSVSDTSGNTVSVEREIYYDDPTPPELELLGKKSITLTAGSAYQEPGYAARDNCDGDISDRVEVSGAVDIYQPGTYTLTYTVRDGYGNSVSDQRSVTVKALRQQDNPVPGGKVIYLTFDDGPSAYTPKLLKILEKYNVKATFFVVKTGYFDKYIADIVAAGHSIGIHSMSHDYQKIYASEEAFFKDLLGMQDLIYQRTGIKTTLMRFPGGSSNTSSYFNPGIMTRLTRAVQEQGFQYFDWNISSGDAGQTTSSQEVFNKVKDSIRYYKNAIVLQHDSRGFSVDAVERIINWGLANGYVFLPLNSGSPTAHHGLNN